MEKVDLNLEWKWFLITMFVYPNWKRIEQNSENGKESLMNRVNSMAKNMMRHDVQRSVNIELE